MKVLSGKAVVITGAGRGLGAAYAMQAARHGARVIVNDIDGDEAQSVVAAIRAEGGAAVAVASDISDPDGALAPIDACQREFGTIDALCNNAAVFWMASPLDEEPAAFRRMIEVNLIGTAYVGMAAARAMAAHGRGGAILNTVSGAQSGSPGMASYGASKGGVAALTYSWALDLAPHGIRVNAISPQAHTRTARSIDPDLHRDKPPERCAPAAIYLLSDLAKEVNGQVVFVVGDELALVSHPGVVMPSLHSCDWSVETIAQAFAQDLAERQMPVGRSRQEISIVSASDSFDAK